MTTSNLTRPEVSFFVEGSAGGRPTSSVVLKLTKVDGGWTQRVVSLDDTREYSYLNVNYVSDETRDKLYEWFVYDLKGSWKCAERYE